MSKKEKRIKKRNPRGSKFFRVFRVLFAWLVGLIFRIKVVNKQNEPDEGGYIVCANHISATDPIMLCYAFRKHQVCFMAKKELFKHKLPAAFFRSLGAYPIDRSGANVSAVKGTVRMLQEGHCTAMFPQGTRHSGVHPSGTPIKSGVGLIAARAKVPVLPVMIRNDKWKIGIFRRTEIIIGEPIHPEELLPQGDGEHVNYSEVSRLIFDRICALEEKR